MKVSIFYSWQSDLPGKTNRYFIEGAIEKSLKDINKDNRIVACIDRDTKDELGSPDIRSSTCRLLHKMVFHCSSSTHKRGSYLYLRDQSKIYE